MSSIVMQDWRPFVSSFVPNTYTEFSQRVLQEEAVARRRGPQVVPPLFAYTPSAKDVQIQEERFRSLQERVLRQRRLIKLRDKSWTQGRSVKEETKKEKEKKRWKEGNCSNVSMVKSQAPSERELGKKTHRKTRSDGGNLTIRLELFPPLSTRHKEISLTPASSFPPVPLQPTFWMTELTSKTTSK